MVTAERARTGSQSLSTTGNAGPGRPFGAPFQIHALSRWWMETWVYVAPSTGLTSSSFSARSSLGTAFFISIGGDGLTYLNTGSEQSIRSLGSSVLDRWVKLRIEKIAPLTLRLSVTGDAVNESFTGRFQTPWDPQQVAVGTGHSGPMEGIAYWDDLRVSDSEDEAPAVPEPATLSLVAAGLAAAAAGTRRRARG